MSHHRLTTRRAWATRALLAAGLALAAGGCSHRSMAPPTALLPPQVLEVFPAARATRVPFTTPIWAHFREPLDSTSIDPTTVFLKIDTQRIPMTLALQDSGRTVVIRPLQPLRIARTHTVEFTPRVRTAAGVPFASTWFWQFTTISVRAPQEPRPYDLEPQESPLSCLTWAGTDSSAGDIVYSLWTGTDSAVVRTGSVAPRIVDAAQWLPPTRWPSDTQIFWRVMAHNRSTGDSAAGAVWSFHTLPVSTPVDSLVLPLADEGTWDDNFKRWLCRLLQCASSQRGLARFSFAGVDSSLKLADAWLELPTTSRFGVNTLATVWVLADEYAPCDTNHPGLPPLAPLGFLGNGTHGTNLVRFLTDAFAIHVQARVRRLPLFDYALNATSPVSYNPFDPTAGIHLVYYRLPAAPTVRAGAGVR